jgi:hypothetical protein
MGTYLDRYDNLWRTQKRRYRRFRTSASIFKFIWISLLHNVSNVFGIELRVSVMFSVIQTVMEFKELGAFRLG